MKFTVKMDTQKRVVSAILLLDETGVFRQKRKPTELGVLDEILADEKGGAEKPPTF